MAHVTLITLGVGDVERATRYYEALGWRRSSASQQGTISFLIGGTVTLGLFGRDALAEDAAVEFATGGGHAPVALAMNLGSPSEVDAAIADAEAAGGRVTKAAAATDWGGYSGYVADLDGHLWEVAHNPFATLLETGQWVLPED